MSIERRSNSRYKLSDIIVKNGNETWGIMKKFDFLNRDTLKSDEIDRLEIDSTLAGNLVAIADKLYGRADLDWVLLMFNNQDNPFEYPNGWPGIGTTIEYPIAAVVLAEV